MNKQSRRGGVRIPGPGKRLGRKPSARAEGKALRTVYAWLTPQEHDEVNAAFDATQRGAVLIRESKERIMSKLIRIQIRDSATSDTFRAVKIFNNGEVEVKRDYGTIGEAARDNFDAGVKVYRGKKEITRDYAESGEIG